MEQLTIREKTTAPITMQLLADGAAIDLTGAYSVVLEMKDSKNRTYRYSSIGTSPAVEITDSENGEVTFTPPDEKVFQYLFSPYRFYFRVYITSDQNYSVPEDRSAEFRILKEY